MQVLDGKLFVTFALQDDTKHDDVAGPGNGFVDEFDLQGHLLARVASGGPLDSPWGLAIAPSSFGTFGGDLLVGNFGDGTIEAYNLKNDQFVGNLTDASGNPIVIPDLWELIPGNNGSAGNSNTIYFTAGVQDEMHGLFGSLTAEPDAEPGGNDRRRLASHDRLNEAAIRRGSRRARSFASRPARPERAGSSSALPAACGSDAPYPRLAPR